MSDLKLWSTKTGKIEKAQAFNRDIIEDILIKNSEELLGLKILFTNYPLDNQNIDNVAILALDEVQQLVVVEYRKHKYHQTIGKGLMQLDYILKNESKFKLLINDLKLASAKEIIYKPRLLVIGEDFSEYDQYAIRQIPYNIELIKIQTYANGFLNLHKQFINLRSQVFKFNVPTLYKQLFNELCEFVFNLGDEVVGVGVNNTYTFRKIKTFLTVDFNHGFVISSPKGIVNITNRADLEAIFSQVEVIYNEA